MPSSRTVTTLVESGLSYDEIADRLGITPGLAYLIATGTPADGGDTADDERRRRTGFVASGSQSISNPPHHNPTYRPEVVDWVRRRAAAEAGS